MALAIQSGLQQTVTINIVSGNQTINTINNPPGASGSNTVATVANRETHASSSDGTLRITRDVTYQAIPRLTTLFTGRKKILELLARWLDPSKPAVVLKMQRIFVLYGLGGAGKTQIMAKFAIEFGDKFDGIYYIDATTLETIQSSLERIARSASAGTTVDDALGWLSRQRSEWLLLIDNADDPAINLQQYFPRCAHGNILITTRNPDCCQYAPDSSVKVAGMDPQDAVDLLLKSAMVEHSKQNRNIAASICEELGFLALAITQAGAYIAQACPLREYLKVYRQDRAKLLQRRSAQASDDYKWTVYTTWEMSMRKLTPTSAMLLRLFAVVHHDRIPQAIFENSAASKDTQESFLNAINFLANFQSESGEYSNQKFLDSIWELASYSLINVDVESHTYSIHPLVHTWAFEQTSSAEQTDTRVCMLQLLALSVPMHGDQDAITFQISLLPHLDHACAGGIDVDMAEKFFHVNCGGGRWKVAEDLQQLVLKTKKECLGNEHPDTLTSMSNLALTYWNQGRLKEAEELSVQVLEARRQILGQDHPDTLLSMNSLALTYWSQGRWKEAEELGVQVLEAKRQILGQDHPDTLKSMSNLALTYWKQGRWKEAEELGVQVLEAERQILGQDHPDTLTSMNNLALTYGDQGRWKEAEVLEVQALEARKQIFGQDHPDTLTSMNNLALTYGDQGRWKEAEELGVQVLEARRQILGQDHPDTLKSMSNLALIYGDQGRWKEAEVLEVQVLEARRQILGQEHPNTLTSMNNLAVTYQNLEQKTKAAKLYQELLECQRRVCGDEHPDTRATEACLMQITASHTWHKPSTWFHILKPKKTAKP